MQAAAVQFYRLHAAIIQQQAMPILGSENTTNTSTCQKVICLQYTVHLVVVRLNPLIEGFLVKSEPIEQRGGAATLECPLRPLPSSDPYEQNHHYKHAGHHKEEQPLEARRLGSQRVDLRHSRGCATGACQAMLHGPLSGIKDLHQQTSESQRQAPKWRSSLQY